MGTLIDTTKAKQDNMVVFVWLFRPVQRAFEKFREEIPKSRKKLMYVEMSNGQFQKKLWIAT